MGHASGKSEDDDAPENRRRCAQVASATRLSVRSNTLIFSLVADANGSEANTQQLRS